MIHKEPRERKPHHELIELDDVIVADPNGSAGPAASPPIATGSAHARGSAHAKPESDEIDKLAAMDPDSIAYMTARRLAAQSHAISPADVEHVVNARRMRGRELEFLTEEQLAELPDQEFLIDPFIPVDSVSLQFGKPQSFKSFVAIAMSVCLASGADFFGHRVSAAGDVVYIAGEGLGGLKKRVAAFRQHHGIARTAGRIIFVKMGPFDLREAGCVDALVAKIERGGIRPALVVIDTLARAMPGTDEGPKDMSLAIANITRLKDRIGAGTTVLALHHTTKDGAWERGHSALRGGLDVMFEAARIGDETAVTFSCVKMKDEAASTPFRIDLAKVEIGSAETLVLASVRAHEHRLPKEVAKALEALRTFEAGATLAEWVTRSGKKRTTLARYRDDLISAGLVTERDGRFFASAKRDKFKEFGELVL